MVKKAPLIKNVIPNLIKFLGDDVIVAHNAPFDMKFLLVNAYNCGLQIKNPVIDTLPLSRKLYPDIVNHKLETVAKHLCIKIDRAHRSLNDVNATAKILIKSIAILNKQDALKEQERKLVN